MERLLEIKNRFSTYMEKLCTIWTQFSVYCEQFVGLISLIAATAVAIPLFMTNAIPALGITVMALGLMNRDGLIIIAGFIISIVGVAIAIAAVIASWLAIKYLLFSIF